MLAPFLQDRVALYVAGAMTAPERENFELVLDFEEEVRASVAESQEALALAVTSAAPACAVPPAALKTRILGSLSARPPRVAPVAMVVTDGRGLTEWVNPAFTAMCGYSFAELRGRKPGHLLQGPDTDPAALDRIRAAVTARRSCCETVVNYHRNGSRYLADISITPILDDDDQHVWFAAKERILGVA